MCFEVIDAPKHHIRGWRNIQADIVICQHPHHGRWASSGDPVLDFVEFQFLDPENSFRALRSRLTARVNPRPRGRHFRCRAGHS
jgi:hypothetical protein